MATRLISQPFTFDEDDWHAWHRGRTEYASSPTGPTALTANHWVEPDKPASALEYPDTPGRWYRTTDRLIGLDIPRTHSVTGTVQLAAGESVSDGSLSIQAFERQGEFAVRIYNRHAPNRIAFHSIEAFVPSSRWALPARLSPDADTVNLTTSDGTILPTPTLGWLHFEMGNLSHRLRVIGQGGKIWTAFSDESSAIGVHRFRFIKLDRPDATGYTIIDFNRAYLPSVAFSKHFLSPMPTPTNTLEFSVEAGEKWAVFN